jgi:murein DD-endopeptidase MepM/ murein hydrolase activator NlpD
VTAEKATMTQQRDALAAAERKLAALQARTSAAREAQAMTLRQLAADKAQAAHVLAEEEAAQAALKRKIDQLAAEQQGIPSVYNGTFAWPMAGIVTQEFGCTGFPLEAPLGNCPHFHLGIDIAAPMDTPVHAAGDGTVLFVGPNPYDPPGERAVIVIIAHSKSLLTWYAHLDDGANSPVVQKGEVVRQGQLIGFEGNTGISTGPHLLWMVELNGTFENPRLFV